MIALKKVLVPHDFSETSEAAVRYALALAHNFGAQLHLLHVSDKARFEMATEFPLGLDGTLEDAVRELRSVMKARAHLVELTGVFAGVEQVLGAWEAGQLTVVGGGGGEEDAA